MSRVATGWLAENADALVAAARDGLDDRVYSIGRTVAARTLNATDLFGLAADHAARKGRWDEAVRFATLVWMAAPDDAASGVSLVKTLMRAGRPAIARSILAQLLAEDPESSTLALVRIDLALADRAHLAEDLEAVLDCPSVLRRSVFDEIVAKLMDARLFDLAEKAIGRALQRFGDSVVDRRARATLAYRRGAYAEADALWSELASDPATARTALIFRARIAIQLDRGDAAQAFYAEVLEHEAHNAEAAIHLVRGCIRTESFEDAQTFLERRRAASGSDAVTLWLEALLQAARGKVPEALALGALALRRFPTDAVLATRIADLHGDLGDLSAAKAVLEAALTRLPDDFLLLTRRARIAELLREPPAAQLALMERALAQRPTDETALRGRANLLARLGDRRAAVAAATSALSLHPRNVAFWRIRISNLLNLSEQMAADEQVDRARKVFVGEALEDRIAMIEVLEIGERLDEAAAMARVAVGQAPDSATLRSLAARIAVARGRYVEAAEDLEALPGASTRTGPGSALRARVAAAIAYADVEGDAREALFPEAILARVAREAPAMAWEDAEPLVVHVTAGMGAGGAERQLALTLKGQAARVASGGMRPVLAVGDLNPLAGRDFFLGEVLAAGVETIDLARREPGGAPGDLLAEDMRHRANADVLGALPPEMSALALPLYAELVRLKPRVCHLWQDATAIAGSVAAALAGVPRIVIGQGSTRPTGRRRARRWLKDGYRAFLARPGVSALNNSKNGARDYEEWLGLPAGTIAPVYNGYDFAAMRANVDAGSMLEVERSLGGPTDGPVFGGVMRLSAVKRPELWAATAVALARLVPDLRGLLVGDGPMREQILAQIAAAGLSDRIVLAGRRSPVEPWMTAMDVMFLSSVTEGLPNVLIEAQALGVAVASMRVGGAPETVEEGRTGILIDETDPKAIAARIAPLIADAPLRAKFGSAALRWTEDRFSDVAMLDRLAELYAAEPR